ncbi:MAG TPA: hypothetical protein VGQ52_17945 [Gemmatimonadaceae bacterium]|jgi:uncharacterized membrane protein YdjX (TVP38/TMEM64 family)|nr:hypothetical protein [Gemmatimonadaceae bacterium]
MTATNSPSPSPSSASQQAWALIDAEKRRDRFIRRLSVIAWSVTFTIVVVFAGLTLPGFVEMARGALAGNLPWITVVGIATPFMSTLLILSVLVAALSTVGVFLRFRSASLAEIQLRLAALEDMLASRNSPNEK